MAQSRPEYVKQNWPAILSLKNGTYSAEENQSTANAEYYLKKQNKTEGLGREINILVAMKLLILWRQFL